METGKSVVSSKLMWLGAAATVVGSLQSLDWVSLLGSTKAGWVVMGLGVATMLLRAITDKPITGVIKS